tara:strand:+ start:270 stop:455 length:186 start_codon:yes stop_codon:yes gene_type:complete
MAMKLELALQMSIAAHKAGRVVGAARFYTLILKYRPGHPGVNHSVGVLTGAARNSYQENHF